MNLLHILHQPSTFHISKPTPFLPPLSPPQSISLFVSPVSHEFNSHLRFNDFSSPTVSSFSPISLSKRNFRNLRLSKTEASFRSNEEESVYTSSTEFEDLAESGAVYQKTLRLVECSMFAAVSGLAYFLSNSLAIENYFGCFFALPIVISSMRWGVAAGRKTMVATAMLLLVLSGPVKASTYLLMHGLVGFTMGSLWRLGANWGLSICLFEQWVPWDYHKHSCVSHLSVHCHRCKHNSIDECNICHIWDSAFAELWILCILAAHFVCRLLYQAWDEGLVVTAKMAGKGNIMVVTVAIFCVIIVS